MGTHPLLGRLCPSDVHRSTCSRAALTGHGVINNEDKNLKRGHEAGWELGDMGGLKVKDGSNDIH